MTEVVEVREGGGAGFKLLFNAPDGMIIDLQADIEPLRVIGAGIDVLLQPGETARFERVKEIECSADLVWRRVAEMLSQVNELLDDLPWKS